ncbi:hypothetical protein FRC96_00560 [Lujinxingia vulgaris]|uniref:Uncharacterized protein n=1 Tax=Lujinxingia vulgaris TaxID=2600176 RepID=A0A5C6XTD5_9DELT|nr:hypothetical protein [Lujinxingia vulgaris]TXD44276.1 hypothetical protein FRC96_00560 [Lujinxingia vulgaris]
MSGNELKFIRTEIGTLTRFLRDLREDEVIERLQLERRLANARERLAEIEHLPKARSLSIVFGGSPVEGRRSMDAGFGAAALKAFVDVVEAVRAGLMADEPMEGGRLPRLKERSLRIVDRAGGSCGFELELPPLAPEEEPPQGSMLPEAQERRVDAYALAIETTLALIGEVATSSSSDEATSDAVAEMHRRAADKVRAFVKVLADHGALFAAEFEGRQVRLNSDEEVRRVVDALNVADMTEREDEVEGMLIGALPESRVFECRSGDGTLIKGKIDRSVADVMAFKAAWENKEALLRFRVVSSRGKERYFLKFASAPGRR